jgi:hypothetical protein
LRSRWRGPQVPFAIATFVDSASRRRDHFHAVEQRAGIVSTTLAVAMNDLRQVELDVEE